MGGFLYCRKSGVVKPEHLGRSLQVMKSKGLVRKSVLKRSQFELHVYGKMRVETDNVLELDNGDFVVATGTMIYKRRMGTVALRELYTDFCNEDLSFENFLGHFAVWVLKDNNLTVFNDFRGMYHVFQNSDQSVVASAFLPVYESLTERTPSAQEIFEYLTFTAHFDDQTMLKEIRLLDHRVMHGLGRESLKRPKRISIRVIDEDRPFEEHASHMHEKLGEYFSTLASNFGDLQSLGLTGGYDSRLALAHIRLAGARPIVYVQGDADSIDVKVARAIAKGEGFDIQYSEEEAQPSFAVGEFYDRVKLAYHYLDGTPHPGLFSDMAMVSAERRNTEREEKLRLYGMGGEIFRTTRSVPDRPLSVTEFMTSEYDSFDDADYSPKFDRAQFLERLGQKMAEAMSLKNGMMTRQEVELAYPHFTLCRGAGAQMTLQNERAFSLAPYSEPMFTIASGRVPLKYKNLGLFEAELIRLADPGLASYESAYGFAFSDTPNMKTRLKEAAKLSIPISVRPFMHHQIERFSRIRKMPFYLEERYIREIFPDGCPNLQPFIDIAGTTNPNRLSRAYTVELMLSGQLGKVRAH